jgi:divalent metal cation (Fe/Co/Zn/Cd) transporter
VIHLRTQHLGPDELLVGAKLELDRSLRFEEVAEALNQVEGKVREAVPEARVMYLEPDLFHPERQPDATAQPPAPA